MGTKEALRFQAGLLDAVGEAVIVADLEGCVTYWNRAAETLYGWPAAEALGRRLEDLLVPAAAAAAARDIRAQLHAGRAWSGEILVRRRDGSTFLAHVTDTPLRDEAGTLVGVIGVSRDVTEQHRAQVALRVREAQLAEAQRIAHLGSWEWDLGIKRVMSSDEFFRILGLELSRDGMEYLDGLSHVHPDDRAAFQSTVEEAVAHRGAYATQCRVVRPDGSIRWVDSQGVFLAEGGTGAGRIVGTVQDITERREAEARLRESEERLHLALDIAGLGTWEVDVRTGRVVWSPLKERMVGLEPGTFGGTAAAFEALLHPEDRERIRHQVAEALDSADEVHLEYRMVRTDGMICWFTSSGRVYRSEAGEPLRVLGVTQDVTAQQEAAAALQESETRYRRLMEQAGDAIMLIDATACVLEANPSAEALLGYRADELVGKALSDLIAPADLAATPLRMHPPGGTVRGERRMRRRDGTEVPVDVTATTLPDGRMVGIYRDITERKQAERQRAALARSEKLRALGQMASGIAHDLNNALAPVVGYSELLLLYPEDLRKPDIALPELRLIHTGARDAADVVARLREFYRQPTDDEEPTPLEVARLLEEAVALTQPKWRDQAQAEGRMISITVEPQSVPPVLGHASELRGALTNLIFNATDAMPQGGTITLRAQARDGWAVMEVCDTGVGMADEVRQQCLEPFFSTKGIHGTGLGLAMVHGIVQRHRGSIEIESAPGTGTTFRLLLPSASEGTAAEPTAQDEPADGRLRVLVVDDNPVAARVTAAYLARDGHLVSVAESGPAALALVGADTFDVVLTDQAMPDMNGTQLAAAIKARWPQTPIVLVTGFGDLMGPADRAAAAVEAVVAKPVTWEKLRAALGHVKPSRGAAPAAA